MRIRFGIFSAVTAVLFLSAPLAAAQTPVGSVAAGFGVSQGFGGGGDCPVDDCEPLGKGFSGEVAFNAGRHLSVLGQVGYGFGGLQTDYQSVAVDVDSSSVGFAGGVRIGSRQIGPRLFGQFLVGYARGTSTVSAVGLRESFTLSAAILSPGVGGDIPIGGSAVVRVSGGFSFAFVDGGTAQSFGVGTALVYNFGG